MSVIELASKRKQAPISLLVSGVMLLLALAPHRCPALNPDLDILQYNCQTWRRQNGLPANGITAIAQAKDGFLWFGTSAGLVRFDGVEFKPIDFNSVKELRGSAVGSLAASRNGGAWVGLPNSAFGFYDGRKFSFFGKKEFGGEQLNVRTVQETADGTLCIASFDRLARLKTNGVYEEFSTVSAGVANVLSGFQDSQGRFWAGTDSRGVFYWQGGEFRQPKGMEMQNHIGVYAIVEDAKGQIWVGTSGGLYCLGSDLQPKAIPPLGQDIRALLVDRQGVVWIGTMQGGLFRYHDGKYSSLRKSDGLASDSVQALAEDHEGNLWIGTRGGVSQLTDLKFPTYGVAQDLDKKEALAVGASRKGGVWLATPNGLTYFDGSYKTYSTNSGLANAYVKRVFEARNGDVYLVNGGQTLGVLSHGRVVKNFATDVVGMCEDAQGVVVSSGGDLFRAGTNYFTPYAFTNTKPDMGWILNLMTARDGSIWVASVFGIFRVKNGGWQQWPCNVPEMPSAPMYIYEDSEGVVWAALLSGITRLKDNRLAWISRQHGLFDDNIQAIVPDDHDNMWMNSSRGIFRVSRKNLNDVADGKSGRVECVVYDGPECVKTADKTGAQEFAACKTLDGRIWFPGPQGAVAIDPAHIPVNQIAPQVHIDAVVANGKEVDRTGAILVPPGKGELEFRFTGLSFIASQKMKFRYQLEGYDQDWVETQDRRVAFYTNLKPGRYQFRVIAANADGVWNKQGDSLEIELKPHFHQTAWFFGLCVGAGLAGLAGLYCWRVRQLRQKQRALIKARDELEAEVLSRTAELAQSNTELSYEQALLRTLLDNASDHIYFKDAHSRFVRCSLSLCAHAGLAHEQMMGKTDFDIFQGEHAHKAFDDEQRIISTGQPLIGKLEKEVHPDGRITWVLTTKMPWPDAEGKIIGTFGISRDITPIKDAEAKLVEVHQQLVEASRKAGQAEVATGVLHNVGNVLNSVNVSTTVLEDRIKKSKGRFVGRTAAMMQQHAQAIGEFMTNDPKGQRLPSYLAELGETLQREQAEALRELESLHKNVDHIRDIVSMQQSYAKVGGVIEKIDVTGLVEDALRINAAALSRHRVELAREFAPDLPVIATDRHKVLQILINLLSNAKYACDGSPEPDRRITVRVARSGNFVKVSVIDNGVGIPPENLERIFNHGFTTRKDGHGFGLHSGSLAAKELGGSLTVQSDGIGKGATFTLELPV